jgi:hypothetical protein
MSLCIYAFHQVIIKTGSVTVTDTTLAVAKFTSFKTAGIATTSHRVIANVIVTIIAGTMMTTVETIMTTNVAMVMEKVKISTKTIVESAFRAL